MGENSYGQSGKLRKDPVSHSPTGIFIFSPFITGNIMKTVSKRHLMLDGANELPSRPLPRQAGSSPVRRLGGS